MRAALAALAAEEERRRTGLARMARMSEEMDRHLPSPPAGCLLRLHIKPSNIPHEGSSLFFIIIGLLLTFGLSKTMMTAAVHFLCRLSKRTKFITAHHVQRSPIMLAPAIRKTSRAEPTVQAS